MDGDKLSALPSLTVAAHELKSPLSLVRQLSLAISDSNISVNQRESYQHQLIAVADQSIRLVDDLTQAANLQPTLFPLEPTNPLAVCRSVLYEITPMVRIYDRQIEWPASRSKLLVVANHQLLRRVLTNFIDNAIKYTEPGRAIKVNLKKHSGKIRMSVRDFGPRMSLADYRRLLSELETMKTLRTRPESSGLGVFLAAEFAKAMNSTIGIVRHQDGVTFYIDLPISGQMSLV